MSLDAVTQEAPLDLRQYVAVLRVRRRTVAIVALAVLGLVMVYSLRQTSIYTSTAKVLVKPLTGNQQLLGSVPAASLSLDTERELVRSSAVAEVARKTLDHPPPVADLLRHVSVAVPSNTQILEISYSSPRPLEAQETAQAFADAYLRFRTEEALRTAQNVQEGIDAQIRDLQKQLGDARYTVTHARAEERRLQARDRIGTLNSQIALLRTQIASLATLDIDPGAVVQGANLPASPSSPNHVLNAALGVFLGLALGVGSAFVRERLDDRVRGREDLEEHVGAPVLAVIPKVAGWRDGSLPHLSTLEDPRGPASEAYRTLRTGIQFLSAQTGLRTVMVTSATAGEGKSTTAANLAVVLAHTGKRVILVSADLRKPRIHRFFPSASNATGVVDILTGEATLQDCLQKTTVEHLWLLGCGPIPGRPSEIAGSERMGQLLMALREQADFVVVDSAPSLVVTDALAMAPFVDGVLYVADANATTRGTIAQASDQLEQVGARTIGAVLNNFDPSRATSYSYGYRYSYQYRYVMPEGDLDAAAVSGGEATRRRRSPI
jgi:succinoglycan biosynthesis transport protein ExoP